MVVPAASASSTENPVAAASTTSVSTDNWLDATHGSGWFNITGSTFADGTTTANEIKLTMSDLLKSPSDTHGLLTTHVTGDANDTLNLSNLFDNGLAAQGHWSASGSVAQDGVNYTAYTFSGNAQLQVLVDQHIQHVNMA
jgi:prophage DNA circulation protein